MKKSLNKGSSMVVIAFSVLALLTHVLSLVVWPIVQTLLFNYRFDLETIVWNGLYLAAYCLPLLVLIVYGIVRMKSYKADGMLAVAYVLLPLWTLIWLARNIFREFSISGDVLDVLMYPIGSSYNIKCTLLTATCLLAAILCLFKVRNRAAAVPAVTLLVLLTVEEWVWIPHSIYYFYLNGMSIFDLPFGIWRDIGNLLLDGILYTTPFLLTAIVVAVVGTGRKPLPVIEEAEEAVAETVTEEATENE